MGKSLLPFLLGVCRLEGTSKCVKARYCARFRIYIYYHMGCMAGF
jgi:hypothetical protein